MAEWTNCNFNNSCPICLEPVSGRTVRWTQQRLQVCTFSPFNVTRCTFTFHYHLKTINLKRFIRREIGYSKCAQIGIPNIVTRITGVIVQIRCITLWYETCWRRPARLTCWILAFSFQQVSCYSARPQCKFSLASSEIRHFKYERAVNQPFTSYSHAINRIGRRKQSRRKLLDWKAKWSETKGPERAINRVCTSERILALPFNLFPFSLCRFTCVPTSRGPFPRLASKTNT